MHLAEFFLVSTTVCGKGTDDRGAFEINGRIDNGGKVMFSK